MAANGRHPITNGWHPPTPQSPGVDAGESVLHRAFNITTRKLPILNAGPIEQMTENLGIAPPEMIFGNNLISIDHRSGWGIEFNAYDALDRVDKGGESMLQVAHSREWQSTRENRHEGITEVVKPFDWSYSTDYKGTVRSSQVPFETSNKLIPLDLLRRHDPIILFDDVMLYEDEMADNGITTYSCKVRVMPDRMLLLGRFFMRLDHVLIRIRDTRLFIEFGTGEVIREYVAREEKYETVRQILTMQGVDVPAHLRDPLLITDLLPIVDRSNESLTLNSL